MKARQRGADDWEEEKRKKTDGVRERGDHKRSPNPCPCLELTDVLSERYKR